VTQNLDIALRRIRDGMNKRVVWIDALYINQANIPEWNSQVRIIDKVYSGAERVLCWVGPAINRSNEALAALDTSEFEQSFELIVDKGYNIENRFIEKCEGVGIALRHFASSTY
jgi:hypothetical protein